MAGLTVVLDAGVLIAHLDGGDRHHERAQELLLAAADEPFAASALSLAEALVHPARSGRLAVAQDALTALEVRELPVLAGAGARLAELRAATGLKLPDCCVLLAAEDGAAAHVATVDAALAAQAARLGFPPPGPPAA